MNRELPRSSSPFVSVLALVGALVLAGGLFLLVPLTQSLNAEQPEILSARAMAVAPPPPPRTPPPPKELEPDERLIQPKPPLMEQEIQDVPVTRLELSLNPGMGASLAMGVPNMPRIEKPNMVAEIEKMLWQFEELDQTPQPLNERGIKPSPIIMRYAKRRPVKVLAMILINEKGRAKLIEILETNYQHPRLVPMIRDIVEQFIFTKPTRGGKPVKTEGRFPIEISPK